MVYKHVMSSINISHKLWCIASFLFLALICSGQVYQATHLHHYHVDDVVAFEVSAHSFAATSAHDETHHHHDDSPAHEDDREHNFKKKIDWRITRSKTVPHEAYDFEDFVPSEFDFFPQVVSSNKTLFSFVSLLSKRNIYSAFLIIRGPPLLT